MKCLDKILFVLLLFLVGCEKEIVPGNTVQTKYIYQKPQDLTDGISVSDLQNEGLDSMTIKILMDSIDAGAYGIFHSLLIFKNNKLVLEEYFNDWNPNDLHPLFSVTKSLASAVIGIAIDQGHISSVEAPAHDLLSTFEQVEWSEQHKEITLHHLLSMSAGYEWDEDGTSYDNPDNPHYKMIESDDWIKYLLELPLQFSPGERFNYNTGISTLFSLIGQEATGERFDHFAYEHLLSKMDIHDFNWHFLSGDYAATGGSYGGIHLRSRDMAKLGLLYMNEGKWNNENVVSKTWVDESLAPHINITQTGSFTYAYQWWRNEQVIDKDGTQIQVPYAVGHGGQYLFMINEHNMLVVITSPFSPSLGTLDMFAMMEDYILEAVNE
jgi:CubicO group peptidase (beta-lactamase class C family)